jgi:CubicO group peptidase (beta-lactamase class C family)
MNRFESILKQKIEVGTEGALNSITPGLKLRAYERGRLKGELKFGKVYRFYDLASLTKILFTVPVTMRLVEQGKLKPSRPMIDYLPWFPSESVTVKDVLSHSAGLPWWAPFYSKLKWTNWACLSLASVGIPFAESENRPQGSSRLFRP